MTERINGGDYLKMVIMQMADLHSRAMDDAQNEWTGGWLIKDAQGQVLHRFHGIGNVQADANRHAAGWLGRNRPDMVGQEVAVVPEMR